MSILPKNVPCSKEVDSFVAFASKRIKFKIRLKNKSLLMKIIRVLLFFNTRFMEFITTVGKTIYVPDENFLKSNHTAVKVLVHELQHISDHKKLKVGIYGFIYLFPQILALLGFLSLLAIWFSNTWLWCLLFFIFLLPIPSPGRFWAEARGYAMNIVYDRLWSNPLYNEKPLNFDIVSEMQVLVPYFTGPYYYFMWPFKKSVRAKLFDLYGEASQTSKFLAANIVKEWYVEYYSR